jgi:hypothetical protein
MKLKLTVLGLFVLLLGAPVLVSAQVGTQGRGRGPWNQRDNRNNRNNQDCDDRDYDDDDYRNTGYGRGGYNTNDLRNSIQRVRDLSRDFQGRLDNALDNSRFNDRDQEDRINQVAKDFKNKADDLKDRFNNGRDLSRSQNEARELLRLGNELDNFLSRNRLDRQVQNDWNQIARNLDVIADAYGYDSYAGNGRYGSRDDDYYGNNRRNGNNRNGNNRNANTRNGGWRNLPNIIGNGRWPF